MKKEYSILLSDDEIRAVMREYERPGTGKRAIRRTPGFYQINKRPDDWCVDPLSVECMASCRMINMQTGEVVHVYKPYGKVGTRLWVKEDYMGGKRQGRVLYRVSEQPETVNVDLKTALRRGIKSSWNKALFMPRSAARIVVEVTDVRVERLKDVSWLDAFKEGVECVWYDEETSAEMYRNYLHPERRCLRAVESFYTMWESLYGRVGLQLNYWCWVYEFRVLTVNGAACDE